jgi:uncharacterized protein
MTSRLQRFRQHKDEYFQDGANSPVPVQDLEGFSGLDYFEENEALGFSLQIDTESPGAGEIVVLDTSDGQQVEFLRAGRVTFPVDGRKVCLSVLKDLDRGRYFVPFTDATTGKTTYDGGRYLDPQVDRDGKLQLDFNYAYNPYCAYDEGWSCPLPPEENALDVPIEAGEKRYLSPSAGRSRSHQHVHEHHHDH